MRQLFSAPGASSTTVVPPLFVAICKSGSSRPVFGVISSSFGARELAILVCSRLLDNGDDS